MSGNTTEKEHKYALLCLTHNGIFTDICIHKYYGFSVPIQIHLLEDGSVQVYSRNSENNTTKYPDIIARMPKVLVIAQSLK